MRKNDKKIKTEVRGTNFKNLSTEELLQIAIDNGIIDMASVEEKLEMKQRDRILNQHPFSIWQGKNGKWYTYLPDPEKNRILAKRKDKKSLEDLLVDFYCRTQEKKSVTFDEMYFKWRKVQDQLVCDNTAVKYDSDYKRYFKDEEFSNIAINRITEETVKVFICQSVKKKKLCKKACKTLFGYIRNVIKSALINKYIKDDPMKYLEANMFYKYCHDEKKTVEQRTVSDFDMKRLYERFEMDYEKKPNYIPTYAVELATLTGMRVGELAALKWEDVCENHIHICRSEKYNRKKNMYYIDETKNKEVRDFPLSPEIRSVLDRVKKAEARCGYISEWIFANEDGRIHAPMISSCMKNKCRQIKMDEKGIHALRRTLNSKMKCNGVPTTIAAALLGHSEEVNRQYYTYDVSNFNEKIKIISEINKATAVL